MLLPSESAADYEANVQTWLATLAPNSSGEAQLGSHVADLSFRLQRLVRLEQKH